MVKNYRRASAAHYEEYVNPVPDVMASASMYAQQSQRLQVQVPADYYTLPPGPDPGTFQLPDGAQQASFEPLISPLPPTTRRHRASSGAWTVHDDQQLLAARTQGLNWADIKDQHFPNKSANACRKRHERLMERKSSDEWDDRRMQQLAKDYMSMRKEIWSGLAARTGEKWNVVEAKCMSKGLKNLQSAARAASRRDRLEAGAQVTGYDDDSGVSGIRLTPIDDLEAPYSSPELNSSLGAAHSHPSSSATSVMHHHLQGSATAAQSQLCLPTDEPTPFAVATYGGTCGSSHDYYSSSLESSTSMGQRHGGSRRRSSPRYDGLGFTNQDQNFNTIMRSSGRRRI